MTELPEPALTPEEVFDVLEERLVGPVELTGQQLADAVGIDMAVARERWRSLGFTAVGDDVEAFTGADLEALRLTQFMHDLGLIPHADEAALIRTLGRSFSRLAEWELATLADAVDISQLDADQLGALVDEVLPLLENVQRYVWRRHLLGAASRVLLGQAGQANDEDGGTRQAVGFADIVGYTRQTRSLSQLELAELIEGFEDRAQAIVTSHGGRIIKTIGDEILFVADTPEGAAHIALELVEGHLEDEDFPELRVGVSWGPVLSRLGDVFGPTVNIASRLTSVARAGRVLIDKDLAEAVEADPAFKLRRMRRISVKGYRRLEPWVLRRPIDEDELPPVAAQIYERGHDLLRVVEERVGRGERAENDPASASSPDSGAGPETPA